MNEVSLTVSTLVALVGGIGIGALLMYLLSKSQIQTMARDYEVKARQQSELQLKEIQTLKDQQHLAIQQLQSSHHEAQTKTKAEAESQFKGQLADLKNSELSVSVYPFVNTQKEDSLLSKQTRVELGYKYQLFVKGLPCFVPHVEIVETFTQKEVNQETITVLREKAEKLAEAALLVNSGSNSGLVQVARATIGSILKK